ncbi:hypothetical protein [Sporomusa aerivorans]
MDKKPLKYPFASSHQPIVPETGPEDGAYLETLKKLKEIREKAD